jgi:Flp pilus assembly protein TadG
MGVLNRIRSCHRIARDFASHLLRETRGNVAMIFSLALPVLVLVTMGGVDINRASTVRINLQDALDAATLAAARSPYTTNTDLSRVGLSALRANLQAYPDIILREDQTTFSLTNDSVVIASAKVDVKTLVANLVLPPYGKFMDDYLPVGAHSEVNRSSKNLEVALVLDITGSMAGQRLTDLKAAARDLVDMVVQPVQTPFYSRMSVVPYAVGVNLGSYASGARGTPTSYRAITGAAWTTGSSKNITGITRAGTGVVTSSGHGFATGDWIWISGVNGMTQINNRAFRVVKINTNSYSLQAWSGSLWTTVSTTSGSGYSSYSSGGIARKCLVSDCSVVVTANGHGLSNNDYVYISNVGSMTGINGAGYQVANVTTNTYSIGENGASWGTYSSGGRSYCGQYGCEYRVFRNPANDIRTLPASTCVSERTGAQAYTDASPSSARVGFNYANSSNICPTASILPLSSNTTSIKTLINSLSDDGSTAGHIGTAWGWYTVSPNFNGLWPSNGAGVRNERDLLKAVIIMTDGDYNTPYCSGVIAQNALAGSGGSTDKINCDATNGHSFDQARALCDAIKADGIIVYTVGFQVASGSSAADILARCASGSDHAYLPASGADLTDAFKAIGRDITRLRISR